jgi:hypothetical protein
MPHHGHMSLEDIVVQGTIRQKVAGARVEWNADGSVDFRNASNEVVSHINAPSGDAPWLCPGCDLCDAKSPTTDATA